MTQHTNFTALQILLLKCFVIENLELAIVPAFSARD
jgi:hypothetical protein